MRMNSLTNINFRFSEYQQYHVVHLAGVIDLYNAVEVREVLFDSMQLKDLMMVDFSEITYLDFACLAILVEVHNMTARNKGQFIIIGASKVMIQLLKLTHLDHVFKLFNTYKGVMLGCS